MKYHIHKGKKMNNMPKKYLSVLLAAVILVSLMQAGMFGITAYAASSGKCGDNLVWRLSNNGVLTISGTGSMYDDYYNFYYKNNKFYYNDNVPWYDNRSKITSVIIGNGVKSIGKKAFEDCGSLTNITIPDSVKSICKSAFKGCSSLTNITIPDSVTSIGDDAFHDCGSLTNITIPDGVRSISICAFYNCGSLTNITIPDSVESIGKSAFKGCSSLTNIILPDSVKSIGDYAFYDSDSLINITIPDDVTSIGKSAFKDCDNLTSLTLPDSVRSIGKDAFNNTAYYNNKNNWKNGVLYISNHLVEAEFGIKSCEIKDGTRYIADYAFYFCRTLKKITIPDSVKSIGDYAFYHCDLLTSITIPYSVTSIGVYAFFNCKGLISITIPNSVTSIGNSAFYCCGGLTNVTIGNGVTSIGKSAFSSCSGLKSVYFPKSIVTIYNNAFSDDDSITDIYYEGTAEEWEDVIIEIANGPLSKATMHYNCCNPNTHDYISEVTKAATCTASGIIIYTCSECNYTYTETIAEIAHEEIADKAVAATCTKAGKTEGSHCSVCGIVIVAQTEIAKKAHSYTSEVTKSATCAATGVKTYTCSECGDTYTETVAKKAHTYKNVVTKATLTKNGKIVPTCSVCKATKTATTIYYPKTITLSTTSYTYDGNVKKPGVTVKDSKGNKLAASNYTITYASGRKSVGKYSVKITFKGNYSGSKTLYFTINPKATSLSDVTAKSKGFTVKWKKQATQTTGYEIQYATDSKFTKGKKTVDVNKNGTTSKTVSKLTAKKKYYVRIRTYKTVKINGKNTKIYSSWSTAKTVTTKK